MCSNPVVQIGSLNGTETIKESEIAVNLKSLNIFYLYLNCVLKGQSKNFSRDIILFRYDLILGDVLVTDIFQDGVEILVFVLGVNGQHCF